MTSRRERPNFEICEARRKQFGMALPHQFDPTRGPWADLCIHCRIDPALAAASWDCPCRLDDIRHNNGTCACGIVWREQDNGPTRATGFATSRRPA